ncbi:hypothetical protein cyc_03191 [Cyclospora cayetanensis]|uniref:Uncharacterized protein n=1 Tax=Cyclospora cayetanensis TaxID=88456 RepID=A0A1D3D9I7_9EIME|nr:hypothetical protein cyc_03191 [Cyclospora cayetanensis]
MEDTVHKLEEALRPSCSVLLVQAIALLKRPEQERPCSAPTRVALLPHGDGYKVLTSPALAMKPNLPGESDKKPHGSAKDKETVC